MNFDELSSTKKKKLVMSSKKYKVHEDLIIARTARKTLRFIEKNTENFPNKYYVLKTRIIESCYNILEWIYRANIMQDISSKKEIVVQIQMLNFYLEEAMRKDILTNKKFLKYAGYLVELDKMTRSWLFYEKNQ
ncbi:MAG: four helix bundle protein [Bacilli bacterium]|nr:four helix bundle protein [Bacilli bacterium]